MERITLAEILLGLGGFMILLGKHSMSIQMSVKVQVDDRYNTSIQTFVIDKRWRSCTVITYSSFPSFITYHWICYKGGTTSVLMEYELHVFL